MYSLYSRESNLIEHWVSAMFIFILICLLFGYYQQTVLLDNCLTWSLLTLVLIVYIATKIYDWKPEQKLVIWSCWTVLFTLSMLLKSCSCPCPRELSMVRRVPTCQLALMSSLLPTPVSMSMFSTICLWPTYKLCSSWLVYIALTSNRSKVFKTFFKWFFISFEVKKKEYLNLVSRMIVLLTNELSITFSQHVPSHIFSATEYCYDLREGSRCAVCRRKNRGFNWIRFTCLSLQQISKYETKPG